ncbi:hypothetical protein HDU77_011508, partial [Chytriomyces hyalinus]
LIALAPRTYSDREAVGGIYKNDPRHQLGPQDVIDRLRTTRLLVDFAQYIHSEGLDEKHYWDYFTAHFAEINEQSEAKKEETYSNAKQRLHLPADVDGDISQQVVSGGNEEHGENGDGGANNGGLSEDPFQ